MEEDCTWEVMLESNHTTGGGIELPLVVLGRDVWWGAADHRKARELARHLKHLQVRRQMPSQVGPVLPLHDFDTGS